MRPPIHQNVSPHLRPTLAPTPPMFARTPPPPYCAVIFSSVRTPGDTGYDAMAQRMAELAAQQPGYLGAESVRNAEHLQAQRLGRSQWYGRYELRIARVERAYGGGAD